MKDLNSFFTYFIGHNSLKTFKFRKFLSSGDLGSKSKAIGLVAMTLLMALAGCERTNGDPDTFKIIPSQDLMAKTGQDVQWSFKGTTRGRPLKILNVTPDRLPLGLVVESRNGEFLISGKPLRSINSEGHIFVTAFDEEGCKQTLTDGLSFFDNARARFGYRVSGENPLCAPSLHKDNPYFTKTAIFPWFSDQYSPDSISDLKPLLDRVAKASLKHAGSVDHGEFAIQGSAETRSARISLVPPLMAPHNGIASFDECYSFEFDQCGIRTDCVWYSGGCASLSKNSLKIMGN